ncbi:MAG: hypothetical protein Q8P55_02535 [bacterium]|nr:hypothetical protein [bacterium]
MKFFLVGDVLYLFDLIQDLQISFTAILSAFTKQQVFGMLHQVQNLGCSVAMVRGIDGDGPEIVERLRDFIPQISVIALSQSPQDWADITVHSSEGLLSTLKKLELLLLQETPEKEMVPEES